MISASKQHPKSSRTITSHRAQVHGRLGQRRGGRYASSHGQHGARAQRLPQHVKEIVQGRDDARDVRQEAFCASAHKSGAGVLHSTGLGGVMVASAVRGGLAPVRFRAEPSGDSFPQTNAGRPANPRRRCNDIFSSAGTGASPRPLLVPLSQKSSAARGPGPRRVERSRTSPPPQNLRLSFKTTKLQFRERQRVLLARRVPEERANRRRAPVQP